MTDEATIGIDRAREILRMGRSTLLRKARAGIVPASKPAREWVFVESDLIEFIRQNYKKCSTSVRNHPIGGADSSLMEGKSAFQLVQSIEQKRKNLRPSLVIVPGGKSDSESVR